MTRTPPASSRPTPTSIFGAPSMPTCSPRSRANPTLDHGCAPRQPEATKIRQKNAQTPAAPVPRVHKDCPMTQGTSISDWGLPRVCWPGRTGSCAARSAQPRRAPSQASTPPTSAARPTRLPPRSPGCRRRWRCWRVTPQSICLGGGVAAGASEGLAGRARHFHRPADDQRRRRRPAGPAAYCRRPTCGLRRAADHSDCRRPRAAGDGRPGRSHLHVVPANGRRGGKTCGRGYPAQRSVGEEAAPSARRG